MAISIRTGKRVIDILNEDGEKIGSFSFYASDALGAMKRMANFAKSLENIDTEDLSSNLTIERLNELEQQIKDGIDDVLKTKSSDTLFSVLSPFTFIDDNTPFIAVILPEIQKELEKINQKAQKINNAVAGANE